MADVASLKNYVIDGLQAVEFKLIREDSNPDDVPAFHPDMCHQIFGENETIFGYKDLKIRLYYSAGSLDIFFDINYSESVDQLKTAGLKADNITEPITSYLPSGGIYTSLKEFLLVSNENAKTFSPCGEKCYEFSVSQDNIERSFEVYINKMDTKGFIPFHKRMESFIFWFIDAASSIIHDSHWVYFVVYEKYKNKNDEHRYGTVGYSTVYLYYSYPENVRPRVSQMLILPPFQKLGVGTHLLKAIYKHFTDTPKVTDITFEEPSEILQRARTALDINLCKTLNSFAPDKLKDGFSKEMLKEAQLNFKINPKQCRVVYEILRLSVTDKLNEKEYKLYRIEVKKRLNIIYSKQRRSLQKIQDRGFPVTASQNMLPSIQERMEQLINEYNIVEEMYEQVLKSVERLSK